MGSQITLSMFYNYQIIALFAKSKIKVKVKLNPDNRQFKGNVHKIINFLKT